MTTNSDDIDTDKKLDDSERPTKEIKPRVPIYEQPVPPEDDGVYKFNIGSYLQCETPAGYRILAKVYKHGPDPVSGVPSYQLMLIPESSFFYLSREWVEVHAGRVE